MRFEDMSPELKEKALTCTTPEEVLALAKESGYELSAEELEAVSGGVSWENVEDAIVDCTTLGS